MKRQLACILYLTTILSIFILGGCQNIKESDKQTYFKEAEEEAIIYLKNKYKLDIVITNKELLPEMALDTIAMEGHVVEQEAQEFTISYDYTDKKIKNFGMSPAIKKVIIAKGYDPFNK
ncbi:hypothetical protein [Paenibacillus sp. Marseille-Q7038]